MVPVVDLHTVSSNISFRLYLQDNSANKNILKASVHMLETSCQVSCVIQTVTSSIDESDLLFQFHFYDTFSRFILDLR